VRAWSADKGCAACHREIASSPSDPARTQQGLAEFGDAWPRFVTRTSQHFTHVPSLTSMGRLRASFLRRYLENPWDLRPHVGESMLRPNLTPKELDTLVKGWGAEPDEPTTTALPGRILAGETIFAARGCPACHLFGARGATGPVPFDLANEPKARAPDLVHARTRMNRSTLVRWIADPVAVKPDTLMPKLGLGPDEASLVADFLLFAEPGSAAPPATAPAFDPALPVPTYDDVEREVFRAVCWHCHSDPLYNDGDGGPGNTGGFGFAPIGLSLASFDDVLRGSLGPDGRRRSVFRPGPTGEPVLVERLRLRYGENLRDAIPPGTSTLAARAAPAPTLPRGMPLGLPALTAAQFSLVERWVKGGHPGPRPP
jgi:hypothetical protein